MTTIRKDPTNPKQYLVSDERVGQRVPFTAQQVAALLEQRSESEIVRLDIDGQVLK